MAVSFFYFPCWNFTFCDLLLWAETEVWAAFPLRFWNLGCPAWPRNVLACLCCWSWICCCCCCWRNLRAACCACTLLCSKACCSRDLVNLPSLGDPYPVSGFAAGDPYEACGAACDADSRLDSEVSISALPSTSFSSFLAINIVILSIIIYQVTWFFDTISKGI